jgi:hypothetical protein
MRPSRLRLADTDDQSSIASIEVPINGEQVAVAFAELRPLRRTEVSDAVFAGLEPHLQASADHDADDAAGLRSSAGLPVSTCDATTSTGPVRVALVAGELQPGRFVVDLLGHVRLGDEERWHGAGYVLVRPSSDPAVTGAYPQLHGFHDPPQKSIYSDRGYARRWREPLPDSLRLDLFALDDAAEPTDVLSAGYLQANGIFVSTALADDLRGFTISNGHWFDAVATRRGEQHRLQFLQLLPSGAIDFERSTFRIDGGIHHSIREVVQLDDLDAVEALRAELVRSEHRPALVPDSIVMASHPDLFSVPASTDIAMSIGLLTGLNERGRTGIDVVVPDYPLG